LAVLDDIKTLQNIDSLDPTKDGLFNIYIRKAVTLIANYLNIPTVSHTETDYWTGVVTTIQPIDVATTYNDAVIEYVIICLNKKGNEGIKQSSQGSRSQTYGNDLPDSVKALLPLPYATCLSTRGCYNA
jgi:hypothetical protein